MWSEAFIFGIWMFVIIISWQLNKIEDVLNLIDQRLTWIHEDMKEI